MASSLSLTGSSRSGCLVVISTVCSPLAVTVANVARAEAYSEVSPRGGETRHARCRASRAGPGRRPKPIREGIMRVPAVLLAAALALAPLGARAANLVVWWEGELFPKEDEAVREIAAAFERKTGR